MYKHSIAAAKAAQKNGTLFIFAAGNDQSERVDIFGGGVPYFATELVDSWLTVVASNDPNTEASYTNRCGVAQVFCVTAPGTSIKAAKANSDNGHISYSGPSMAAPHVTGLAAILMQKFPTLSASAIATHIKKTPSLKSLTGKNGEPITFHGLQVMQSIFGYGLVNQAIASASIGSLIIATGENVFDSEFGIDIT